MQNQVSVNPERANPVSNPVTVAAPFIFTSGEVVNLASFVSSANTKAPAGNDNETSILSIKMSRIHFPMDSLSNYHYYKNFLNDAGIKDLR